MTQPSPAAQAPAAGSRWLATPIDWADKLRGLLLTLAFCLAVAALISLVGGHGYAASALYSVCIGSASWAIIDFGRHALPSSAQTGWPQGWACVVWPACGLVGGFVIGTLVADLINGRSSFSAAARARLTYSIVVSAIAGSAISYWFYSRVRARLFERRMAEARHQATEAQLKLLEAQLEPHMLFNTLANLRVLIGIDPAQAQAMLDRLIAFLRATLNASRAASHSLQAEFDRLADYLALMQLRMGPRLQVALELPAELRGARLPPLLLQPLVENGIRHGLEPHVAGGRIEVRAARDGAMLVLDVRDTGAGWRAPSPGGGVGTQLVRERLATVAGAQATLELRTPDDGEGGTLARVRLPLVAGPLADAAHAAATP